MWQALRRSHTRTPRKRSFAPGVAANFLHHCLPEKTRAWAGGILDTAGSQLAGSRLASPVICLQDHCGNRRLLSPDPRLRSDRSAPPESSDRGRGPPEAQFLLLAQELLQHLARCQRKAGNTRCPVKAAPLGQQNAVDVLAQGRAHRGFSSRDARAWTHFQDAKARCKKRLMGSSLLGGGRNASEIKKDQADLVSL